MNLNVVLVRTEYSSNIGSAARALANMGGHRLILIDPRCPIDDSAHQMAAGAQAALRTAKVYPTWADFYAFEGEGLRIGLTRRGGRKRKVFALDEKLRETALSVDLPENLYLIFGPEADGLDSEDLGFANWSCHLPVYGEFASYNLAQAVLLALFQVRQAFPSSVMPEQIKGGEMAPVRPFYFPDELIKTWLKAMGFDIKARKASAYLTLRRLFMQNQPTKHEIQVLEAILQQNIRKLNNDGSVALSAPEEM